MYAASYAFSAPTGTTLKWSLSAAGTLHATLRNQTTGFTEQGTSGLWEWVVSTIPDGYRGVVVIHSGADLTALGDLTTSNAHAILSVNPGEIEIPESIPVLNRTTIATLASQTFFALTAGSADNNAYKNCVIIIQDAASTVQKAVGIVSVYDGATKEVTLAIDPAVFTMAVGDYVTILADKSAWDEVTLQHASASTFGEGVVIGTGGIKTTSFAAGAINAAAIANDSINNAKIAANAVTEIQSGLSTLTAAQVNAEVLDVLNVDTFAEPGQEAPASTNTIRKMLHYLFKAFKNKSTQSSTTYSLYDDAGTVVDHKATVSDDGTVLTKNEIGTGP